MALFVRQNTVTYGCVSTTELCALHLCVYCVLLGQSGSCCLHYFDFAGEKEVCRMMSISISTLKGGSAFTRRCKWLFIVGNGRVL